MAADAGNLDAAATPAEGNAGSRADDFADLVARHAPMVHARCRRSLGAADADDAVQAVFLVLLRKRAHAAASPAMAAWLLRVADNVVRNALRDRQRRRAAELAAPAPVAQEEAASMDELRDHVDACLARVPDRERRAIELRYLGGYSLAEVAAATGVPLRTAHARIERGLVRLRGLLGGRGVAVATAGIAAAIAGTAAEPVDPALLDRLRALDPHAGNGHAAPVPAHVHRWSRRGWSPMHTCTLVGAIALVAAGALAWQLRGGEPDAPVAVAQPIAAAAAAAPPAGGAATTASLRRGLGRTEARWSGWPSGGPPAPGTMATVQLADGATARIPWHDLPLLPGEEAAASTGRRARQPSRIERIDGIWTLVGQTPDGVEVRLPLTQAGSRPETAGAPAGSIILQLADGPVVCDPRQGWIAPDVLDRIAVATGVAHPLGDLAGVPGVVWDGVLPDEDRLDAPTRAAVESLRANGGRALIHRGPSGAYRLHWVRRTEREGRVRYEVQMMGSDGRGVASVAEMPLGAG